jgi:hypothetical protein
MKHLIRILCEVSIFLINKSEIENPKSQITLSFRIFPEDTVDAHL